ncbi:chemotaxis protein CheD [Pectinatus frisingensis]|uniref:chemotaxis protein CheD n=1 Tax=Pectinatus frisingensis TaxID=865 RepID=UPI0018C5170D|nr:chemotaxis protein CheD [Pectinatus frisingensis]
MAEALKVGIADYKVGKAPDKIISYGLGSCIGITLYDPVIKIGGLVHIMLPDSTQARANENPAKFADTGIPLLLDKVISMGAVKTRLIAKLAGGSQMFQFAGTSDIMAIGKRNAELARKTLQNCAIKIAGEDLGGTYGRTVEIDLETGLYKIRTINKGEKTI